MLVVGRCRGAARDFLLTIFCDLTEGILVGFALGAVLFIHRMAAANVLSRVAAKAHRQGIRLFITGASPAVRRALLTHRVSPPRARYRQSLERAIADIKGRAADEAAAS